MRIARDTTLLLCAAVWLAACGHSAARRANPALSELHVTSGTLTRAADGTLQIRSSMRAESELKADRVKLEPAYLGAADTPQPLASGEIRRQIGIKLRARDSCNVVYVMWQIEPRSAIEVSVKSNPGLHTHVECGDRGYQFIRPELAVDVPAITLRVQRSLAARLQGRQLEVFVDRTLVWRGALPASAFDFDGPAGLRADNGRFNLRFVAE